MNKVKLAQNFSPNVGTLLLIIAGWISPAAHAAYTVIDLDEPPTQVWATPAKAPPRITTTATHIVPFYGSRVTLGQKGRQKMRNLLVSARRADAIEVLGLPSVAGDADTAKRRAEELKSVLVAGGVAADKIRVTTGSVPQPNYEANVFNCLMSFGAASSPNTNPVMPVVAHQQPRLESTVITNRQTPTIERAKIDEIVQLYVNDKISKEDVLNRLISISPPSPNDSKRPNPARREVVLTTPSTMPTPAAARTWHIFAGSTLKAAVENWSKKAGWNKPTWSPHDPYYIESDYPFQGTLLDALTQLNELVPNLDFQISLANKTITVTERK